MPAGPRHDEDVDADIQPFLSLRFQGGRFDAGTGMPVETLGELVAYRELLLEVARLRFLAANPGRRRAPKGFNSRLALRLRRVEGGSALPILEREAPRSLPLPDEFDEARDLISSAVAAAANGEPIPPDFPVEALVYFNRFGQGLEDDESIELRVGTSGDAPRYTQQVRKSLLAGRSRYQRETSVVGWMSDLDAERMRFRFRAEDGTSISGNVDIVTFEEARRALAPSGEGPRVLVRGVGLFERDGDRLVSIDSIHELVPIDVEPRDAVADAVASARVPAGWLDGEGAATDQAVGQRAEDVLTELVRRGAEVPRVYPVPDGGLQAEWTIGAREVSVTFDPDGSVYAVSVDVGTKGSEDATVKDGDLGPIERLLAPQAS